VKNAPTTTRNRDSIDVLFGNSRDGLLIIAILVSIFLIGNYLSSFDSQGTKISNLVGSWKSQVTGHDIVLEIESDSQCFLLVSGIKGDKRFYTGRCVINRNKAPTSLSLHNLPAYDFSLHTIIERIDDKRLLMAPFATLERARPITFSDSFIMEKI
jgi:hypothetical protein